MIRCRFTAGVLTTVFLISLLLPVAAAAQDGSEVREFPGWHGAGTRQTGPVEGSEFFDCWYSDEEDEEEDDGPGMVSYQRGWRYSPAGWWFQKSDGSWLSDGWHYVDSRWYLFDQGGHLVTGWYTDGNGNKFYLNPVDDGTYGAMRIGWQMIDGKAYYFNTLSDGTLGRLLVNTTTPDGYVVGADGALTLP